MLCLVALHRGGWRHIVAENELEKGAEYPVVIQHSYGITSIFDRYIQVNSL